MSIFGIKWVQNWAQIQGVPEIEDDGGRFDFWTTLGHPGYLEPIRQIWVIWGKFGQFGSFGASLGHLGPKIWPSNIALKILFATSFWDNLFVLLIHPVKSPQTMASSWVKIVNNLYNENTCKVTKTCILA